MSGHGGPASVSTEIQQSVAGWNDTATLLADITLAELVTEQAWRTPDRTALVFEHAELTYGAFATRVNRLARLLVERGAGPGRVVAVAIPRCLDLVVALHAVLQSGAAYLPLDPEYPADRLAFMLDDAAPVLVLSSAETGEGLPDGPPRLVLGSPEVERAMAGLPGAALAPSELCRPLRPLDAAYVIYTSGSTGRPKGVVVPHRGIVNRLVWMQAEYRLDAGDRVLQKTPSSFDVSVWEFFWPLIVGATLVVARPDGHRDPTYLVELINRERVTTVHFVPSMLDAFLQEPSAATCTGLRRVICSGEALPADLCDRFTATLPADLHNLYGPTEASVDVTYWDCGTEPGADSVPIGRPVWNTQVHVLGPELDPVPMGELGELYLGGVQLARGYLGRPGLSAERFVADPVGPPGSRIYRTGDLGRWRPDGTVEYAGRSDHQVKIRGFRVELGEIETALRRHPSVANAAVTVREDHPGVRRLVGYLVQVPERPVDCGEVLDALRRTLPDHMVPSVLVVLPEFPLTPSGKLDRGALPAPRPAGAGRQSSPPRSPQEHLLCDLIADVLGLDAVGVDDGFVALGGDSITAILLVLRARAAGLAIDHRAVFDHPTVGGLAAASRPADRDEPVARLEPIQLPKPVADQVGETWPELTDVWPLTPLQEGLLFHASYDEADQYTMRLVFDLAGPVEPTALRHAAELLLQRHPNLRAGFLQSGLDDPVQFVPAGVELPWREVELTGLTEAGLAAAVEHEIAAAAGQPFDLAVPPLIRFTVLRLGPELVRVVIVNHHIVLDGWSMPLLVGEWLALYRAVRERSPLPKPPTVGYRGYLARLAAQDRAAAWHSWSQLLAGIDGPTLVAGADGERPAGRTRQVVVDLDEQTTDRLARTLRAAGFTMNTAVQAAWAMLVGQLTGRTDIVFGTVVSDRTPQLAGVDKMIGFFLNTVPLRTAVASDRPLTELLTEIRKQQAATTDRLCVGLSDLQRLVPADELFDTVTVFENYPTAVDAPADGPRVGPFETNYPSHYPLSLYALPGGRLRLCVCYQPGPFTSVAAERLAERLLAALSGMAEDLSVPLGLIAMLGPAELAQSSADNDTDRPLPDADVSALFERQVAATPGAPAVLTGAGNCCYQELNVQANRLARVLVSRGVGPGSFVALALPRTVDLVIALLAVAKAGAAYLPIDPDYPTDRIRLILEDARPGLLLTHTAIDLAGVGELPRLVLDDPDTLATVFGQPDTNLVDADRLRPVSAADAAYVIHTSGSTGRPKGVVVPRAALTNFLLAMRERFPLGADDRLAAVTTIAFDIAGLELYLPLLCGASVVPAPKEAVVDPGLLAGLITGHRVTVMQATPALWQAMVDEAPESLRGLRILVGGEALPQRLSQTLRELGSEVTNLYGPTETTVWSTAALLGERRGAPTIGRPIWNTTVHVLDGALRPVFRGTLGELYIGGAGLARGYLNQPGLTAQRFVADPFGPPGSRLYRTGDLVRWATDGNLDFAGRVDHQVKLRGFRIEPGEIEAVIGRHTGAARVVVVLRDRQPGDQHSDRPGDPILVAYVVPAPGTEIDGAVVRDRLKSELPPYMVPSAVLVIDALPLTPNGKLDRAALPAPDPLGTVETGQGRLRRVPRSPRQEVLCGLFAEVLGLARVSIDDDFFQLGGNSLLAIRLISRVRSVFRVELRIKALFDSPTVATLVDVLGDADQARPPLERAVRPQRLPLSFAQRRLWFLNRFDGRSATYNVPFGVRLTGRLEVSALQAAVADVVGRHETLRTVFREHDGDPHQVVLDADAAQPAVPLVDVSPDELRGALVAAARAGFDLSVETTLRVHLFRVDRDEHVLLLVLHHIAVDGWSLSPLLRDLAEAYAARRAGRAPDWQPLPIQYADYTLWQRAVLGDGATPDERPEPELAFWTTTLAGLPDHTDIPADRRRPVELSYQGGNTELRIDADLHARLAALARQTSSTVFMVLQAGLAGLLTRLGAGTDIPIGTPVAGRVDEKTEQLVGLFINTIVLRTDTAGDPTFRDLVERVRGTDVAAFSHPDTPFERLVEQLQPSRSLSRHPLFQVMLVFQNALDTNVDFAGLTATAQQIQAGIARLDLTFDMHERRTPDGVPAGIEGVVEYSADLFDGETVRQLTERLVRLLDDATRNPSTPISRLEILSDTERSRFGLDVSDRPPTDQEFVTSLFERQVERIPDGIAIEFDGTAVTYAGLNEQANRLAHHLAALGVGTEDRVALVLPRSHDLVVGWLAVLKCGACYLPVDPRLPTERVEYLLDDARPTLVLTTGVLRPGLARHRATVVSLDDEPTMTELSARPVRNLTDADRVRPLSVHTAAYVIYTSGSTGGSKGVTVTHTGIANVALAHIDRLGLDHTSRFLLAVSTSFDVSIADLAMALLSGATLVLPDPSVHAVGDELAESIERNRISHTDLVASMLGSLPDRELPSVRGLVVGGEACSADLAARWAPGRRLMQVYGPTEATVVTTMSDPLDGLANGAVPPIGRPLPGVRVAVLDASLCPVATGVIGELYIGGSGVARGYHDRPGLTAERFVADPLGGRGERLYRTGDLVRWRPDGNLEFVGRGDGQIKVRGFRIELGEVESVIAGHRDVSQVVVVARPGADGVNRLVAYVVPEPAGRLDPDGVRAHVARHLPDYMVPAATVLLDSLPLTTNGKIDRNALPAPDLSPAVSSRPPRTPHERTVCRVFADVLGLPRVGLDDSFFELGGHSLLASRLASRLRTAGLDAAIRTVFEAPTPADLARRLEPASGSAVPIRRADRSARVPLSNGQRRLWFLNRLQDEPGDYNMPLAYRLRGELDRDALEAALRDVCARHESLRTVFPEPDGTPYQRVVQLDPARPLICSRGVAEAELDQAMAAEVSRGFDLTTDLPLRTTLFELGDDEQVLLLVLHHIAADGGSLSPLVGQLSHAYRARTAATAPGWAPLPVQYADFALWQLATNGAEDDPDSVLARQAEFWLDRLAGLPDEVTLPPDRPRPARPDHCGDAVTLHLDDELHRRLAALATDQQASLFMVLHAAVVALLTRMGAGTDVAIGTPITGRTDEALNELVGFFVNTVVLRVDASGDPCFAGLLARTRDADLDAYANQDLPFERLVELVNPARSLASNPLFQIMLVLNEEPDPLPALPGLSVRPQPVTVTASRFDLTLRFTSRDGDPSAGGLDGRLEFNTDLYDRATVQQLAQRLVRLLTAAVTEPGTPIADLDILLLGERERLVGAGPPARHGPGMPELFELQARRTPNAPAVRTADRVVSYRELDRRANRLARRLLARRAGPGSIVAFALPRADDLVATVLAIMKTGAGYLAIEPAHPRERIRQVLADSDPTLLVTNAAIAGLLPAGDTPRMVLDEPDSRPDHDLDRSELLAARSPMDPAYLIYTSGSTGQPKAVVVEHRALSNYLNWAVESYPGAKGQALLHSPISFDLTVTALLVPLAVGGCVHLAELADDQATVRRLRENPPTLLKATPSHLELLAALGAEFAPTDQLLLAGEALTGEAVARWRRRHPDVEVLNVYGPTETTVSCTEYRIAPGQLVEPGPVPIGRPLAGHRLYVLDHGLRPVPTGVPGELYVGGTGVARGYHRRCAGTAERFVADPFGPPGSRMYRTGDLVRRRGDDHLVFLGRTDDQIKVRGHRIEPGEIDAMLLRHPRVGNAVTVLREDRPGDPRLVSYVSPRPGGPPPEADAVREHLARALPGYLVPSAIVVMAALPLTPNGKIDRGSLPPPDWPADRPAQGPRTPLESVLCELFADALGLPEVGIDQSFFELGGHSLLAARLVGRIRAELGLPVTIRSLFETPTVMGLAATTGHRDPGGGDFEVLLPLRPTGDRPPLFCIHPAAGVGWVYSCLLRYLGRRQPVYGLQARGLTQPGIRQASVTDMAADYVEQIRRVRPAGPYHLLGWSFGGILAHAVATRLRTAGERVDFLAVLDAYPAHRLAPAGDVLRDLLTSVGLAADAPGPLRHSDVVRVLRAADHPLAGVGQERIAAIADVFADSVRLAREHRPGLFDGDVTVFRATADKTRDDPTPDDWIPYVTGRMDVVEIPCRHGELTRHPNLDPIGRAVAAALDRVPADADSRQGEPT